MTLKPVIQPCPFCGEQPYSQWYGASGEDDDSGYWGIDCCHAHAHADTEAEAIESWNTRKGTGGDELAEIVREHGGIMVDAMGEGLGWRPFGLEVWTALRSDHGARLREALEAARDWIAADLNGKASHGQDMLDSINDTLALGEGQ